MLLRNASIFFACTLAGCSSEKIRTIAPNTLPVQAEIISVCTIAENPERFVGKVTKIRAGYSVVKQYDSFFTGTNCSKKISIAEGSRSNSDKSVADFNRAGDKLCKARNIQSLCTLEANLVAEVKIRIDTDGELVADPIRVESFTYLPVDEK